MKSSVRTRLGVRLLHLDRPSIAPLWLPRSLNSSCTRLAGPSGRFSAPLRHDEWGSITSLPHSLVTAGAQNQPPRGASKPATCEETQIRQVGFRGTLLSLEPHHVESPQSGHDRRHSVPSS